MPSASERPRRIIVDPEGPLLVEGPVELVGEDGTVTRSNRFMVAVCTCRRTRTAPWCDTSHRCRERPTRRRNAPGRTPPEARPTTGARSPDDDHEQDG